jgi:hypothetical protein
MDPTSKSDVTPPAAVVAAAAAAAAAAVAVAVAEEDVVPGVADTEATHHAGRG